MIRSNILFVTPYLPSPPEFGGARRLHGLMTGLARDHSVSLLSLISPGEVRKEGLAATREYCDEVVTVGNPRFAQGAKRLLQTRSLFSLESFEALAHQNPGFLPELRRMLAARPYQVVNFEFAQMAHYEAALGRDRSPGAPLFVLDEHNIEYEILRRTAASASSLPRRLYNALNWRKLRGEEFAAWRSFDGCTVTSDTDEKLLHRDLPEVKTAVIPNGVDLEHFEPLQGAPIEPLTMLFFGAMNYFPNTDAVAWFADQVLPLLRRRCPGARLRVVGHNAPPKLLALASEQIEMRGFVEDIRAEIARAAVVIAPLRVGGGTRLKILEAMAMGKAVVSTPQGAEGLEVTHGKDVLLAATAEAFAEQVARALETPPLAAELGKAARRLVEERYGWRAAVRRLERFYDDLRSTREILPTPTIVGADSGGNV